MTFTEKSIQIFGFDIYYYGIIIVIGILTALFVIYKLMGKLKMKQDNLFTYAIFVIPLAVIGTRVYFFMFPYKGETADWSQFFNFREGGLAIYGGIIFGLITIIAVALIIKDDLIKMVDVAAPGVLIAQSIGRWGNYVNKEAYGNLVTNPAQQWFPYAVEISKGEWHQATFFYESMWNLIGFILIMLFFKYLSKHYRRGILFSFYPLWYGIGRFWIEGLRTDSLYLKIGTWETGIKISVLISVIGIVAGITGYCIIYRYEIANFVLRILKKPPLERKMAAAEEAADSDDGEET